MNITMKTLMVHEAPWKMGEESRYNQGADDKKGHGLMLRIRRPIKW